MAEKHFQFTAAVRGFHCMSFNLETFHGEEMNCDHEYGNAFDCFSIKTEKDVLIVGHLLREISRATKFLLDRGAKVTQKSHLITAESHRCSRVDWKLDVS